MIVDKSRMVWTRRLDCVVFFGPSREAVSVSPEPGEESRFRDTLAAVLRRDGEVSLDDLFDDGADPEMLLRLVEASCGALTASPEEIEKLRERVVAGAGFEPATSGS